MKRIRIIPLLLAAALFVGCGQQHSAKEIVNSFLDGQLTKKDLSIKGFSKLDSTVYITVSMIKVMRDDASKNPIFVQPIHYAPGKYTNQLKFLRITYVLTDNSGNKTEYKQTYYLDNSLTRVICFKQDGEKKM